MTYLVKGTLVAQPSGEPELPITRVLKASIFGGDPVAAAIR